MAARSTSPDITTVFHARPYLRRRKLHRTNPDSNFLGGTFSNRDNVRAPIQFGRERQPQHSKGGCFLKNVPIHFRINSTSVIRPIKQNQLSFPRRNQQATSCPSPQCLVNQIQNQKPILVVAPDQMPDHT